MSFAVIANRKQPEHTGLSVVPCRSTPSANMEGEGDDLGEERSDRFLPGRAHLGAAVAERRDDLVGVGELAHRPADALGGKAEIVHEAPPRDTRDELASLHWRQA